jgi:adenosine deaminase
MDPDLNDLNQIQLVELHCHLGSSVTPTMLWEIAHNQGLKLPTKDYWEFVKLVTIYDSKPYEEYLVSMDLIEKIQSSPEALFTAAETTVSGAYRKNNITLFELRFNPILRARGGERDLDHLIIYALQGVERAMLKYPVSVGVILMMDRRFTHDENAAIIKKAIKYKSRGIIGIDLAGPLTRNSNARTFSPRDIVDLTDLAHSEGLGVTVHTGEATDTSEMWEVVKYLKPQRIGHGIAAVHDPNIMEYLIEHEIVLDTCPISNLRTQVVSGWGELKSIYRTLISTRVPFTINTDNPGMLGITLRGIYQELISHEILSQSEIINANQTARQATFIGKSVLSSSSYYV